MLLTITCFCGVFIVAYLCLVAYGKNKNVMQNQTTINEFNIGDKVSGYGNQSNVRGVVVGISENPPFVQVKWEGAKLNGQAGSWEEVYMVQKVGGSTFDCQNDNLIA